MRHKSAHVSGVSHYQSECTHRCAAAREHLHRAGAKRDDDAVQILGVLLGGVVGPAVVADAAANAAGVVRDDGAVAEVRRECGEAAGVHGSTDHEQR